LPGSSYERYGSAHRANYDGDHNNQNYPAEILAPANLPYQISTPLLFRFIELKDLSSSLTLMLQKEVAERMVASPGSKSYGPLSVFVQLYSNTVIYSPS
jgi:16S rRNA A1518/A1519 N6-dimethyltransferase RsmA/KsgA/DIM1 with predicted DNA glycosylase/AP lyase activity